MLHITTAAPWRMALAVGSVVTPSLAGSEGFIHLSAPEQVHLPADRLYAGRDDLLLLVIDPARLDAQVRWEPGVPSDPDSMLFPHFYGSLPTSAVTSVVPWRPGPQGFEPPGNLPAPTDVAARARSFSASLSQRRAAVVRHLDAGFAVLDPRVRHSHEHNCLWLSGACTAPEIGELAEACLTGCEHRRVVLDQAPPADLEWEVEEARLMVRRLDAPAVRGADVDVVPVTTEVIARLWGPQWRAGLPDADDEVIDQLIAREPLADAHVRVVDLAVLDDGGTPISSAQLRIDGATAALEAVMTDPRHHGQRLAGAVVAEAIDRARRAGCDLLVLEASADDWPRHWYARLGFQDVGTRWVATHFEA
ncbi:GNAT family N-acetyltransferase [Kineosphaera limosa]|uniref:GNAT family N-acetyltransferase n=1 Tax=Kineosphaera limosa TaxID=111564 RepID=UPI00031D6242